MLKQILFFYCILLWFHLKPVSLVGDGFSFSKKSYVVNLNVMWERLEHDNKKRYVFTIYHKVSCPYCIKVRNVLKNNEHVSIVDIPYDNSKLCLKRWTTPILIKFKSVYVDDQYNKTNFYFELLRRANKVQIPALGYRNFVMFESQDIITLIDKLTQKIINEKNGSDEEQIKKDKPKEEEEPKEDKPNEDKPNEDKPKEEEPKES